MQRSAHQPVDRPLAAITLMLGGVLVIPLMDACAKLLAAELPVLQVVWARFVFHLLWLLPLILWLRLPAWRAPPLPGLQAARGLLLLLATLLFFLAIRDNPLPVAAALLFVAPIVVGLLAPVLLGEPFRPLYLAAAGTGFVGVLVVLRPTGAAFQPSVLFALGAGVAYAFYILATRRVSGHGAPVLTLFYSALAGALFMSLSLPWIWSWPSPRAWLLMSLMGLFAALSHFLIIRACELGQASVLAPFSYAEFISAAAVSYWVFGYLPDAWVWAGMAIIGLSGLSVTLVEARRRRGTPEPLEI